MPEPVERFQFMKSRVQTQVDTSFGPVLCFIDIETPGGFPDVSVGWTPSGDRFGVYVNGEEVYPPDGGGDLATMDEIHDLIAAIGIAPAAPAATPATTNPEENT